METAESEPLQKLLGRGEAQAAARAGEFLHQFQIAQLHHEAALVKPLNELIAANRKKPGEGFADALAKLQRQFQELRAIDYFGCPAAHDLEMLFQRAARLAEPRIEAGATLEVKPYQRCNWLTRPRPQIDRVGSAWLIRKFIDPRATFVFAAKPNAHPEAIPYDMMDVEFTHHGDDCTFETLLKGFAITDAARAPHRRNDSRRRPRRRQIPAPGVQRPRFALQRLGTPRPQRRRYFGKGLRLFRSASSGRVRKNIHAASAKMNTAEPICRYGSTRSASHWLP